MRLSVAVAKVIDENNVSIADALKYAGVKLKPND